MHVLGNLRCVQNPLACHLSNNAIEPQLQVKGAKKVRVSTWAGRTSGALSAAQWPISHDDGRVRAIKSITNRPFMTQEL